MAGIAGVAAAFELGEFDTLVASVAASAYDKMKSYRRYGTGLNAPAAKRQRVSAPIVSNGTYKGDFYKKRRSVTEGVNGVAGYSQEQEIYGSISQNDAIYFTVQSANLQMVSRALGMAFARMIMWKHYGMTYSSANDYLFGTLGPSVGYVNQLQNIVLYLREKNSGGQVTDVGYNVMGSSISTTTTLGALADQFAAFFTSTSISGPGYWAGDFKQFTGYQLLLNNGNQCSPRYSIDNQQISLSVLQVINLQNTTPSDDGSTTRESVSANPVVGKCYHMHGIYPDIEVGNTSVPAVDSFSVALQRWLVPPHYAGIHVPDIAPSQEWKSLPRPQVFANILSCQTGLRLDPGEIKKDVLKFNFSGRLNDFLRGFSYLGSGATPTGADVQPIYSSDKLGTCKLFAFEKVVPTGADALKMNYHIDRYIHCYVPAHYESLSIRQEFASVKTDFPVPVVAGAPAEGVSDAGVVVAPVDGDVDVDLVLP